MRFNAIFSAINTTGINGNEFATFHFSTTILAVASQPREIRDQRISGTRQAVKQRGFSDIRAPDERNHRYHDKSLITQNSS
ncbi:hypothetical protein D3C75_643340 [compost metagenome]